MMATCRRSLLGEKRRPSRHRHRRVDDTRPCASSGVDTPTSIRTTAVSQARVVASPPSGSKNILSTRTDVVVLKSCALTTIGFELIAEGESKAK